MSIKTFNTCVTLSTRKVNLARDEALIPIGKIHADSHGPKSLLIPREARDDLFFEWNAERGHFVFMNTDEENPIDAFWVYGWVNTEFGDVLKEASTDFVSMVELRLTTPADREYIYRTAYYRSQEVIEIEYNGKAELKDPSLVLDMAVSTYLTPKVFDNRYINGGKVATLYTVDDEFFNRLTAFNCRTRLDGLSPTLGIPVDGKEIFRVADFFRMVHGGTADMYHQSHWPTPAPVASNFEVKLELEVVLDFNKATVDDAGIYLHGKNLLYVNGIPLCISERERSDEDKQVSLTLVESVYSLRWHHIPELLKANADSEYFNIKSMNFVFNDKYSATKISVLPDGEVAEEIIINNVILEEPEDMTDTNSVVFFYVNRGNTDVYIDKLVYPDNTFLTFTKGEKRTVENPVLLPRYSFLVSSDNIKNFHCYLRSLTHMFGYRDLGTKAIS